MSKEKFKEDYHVLRKARFNFDIKLNTGNYPCGYDDMLCERFANHEAEFLESKPELRQVMELKYCFDPLTDRQNDREFYAENWQYWLKARILDSRGA